MALISLIICTHRFYYFYYISIIKIVQSLYVTDFSLCGDQYEFTHTSKNSAITSGRKTFGDMAEDTLEINYI